MKLDAIIILGAGLTKSYQLPKEAIQRCDKAIELFHKELPNYIICSGKYSYKFKISPPTTEAKLMRKYLIKNKIPRNKIIKEEHSKDTFGNAYFTRKYVVDPKKCKNIAIVTSDYHIPKSTFLFRKVYGRNYTLHFLSAKSSHSKKEFQRLQKREAMVKNILQKYLSKIKDGDLKGLSKFLYSNHPIYKGKSGPIFSLFVRMIKALEPKR